MIVQGLGHGCQFGMMELIFHCLEMVDLIALNILE